jgi:omega-hydroxy-beta-dihydromenaquinone-9 sulfotransferase
VPSRKETSKPERRWSPHLLAAADPIQAWRVFCRFGCEIDARYLWRAAPVPVISMLHAPLAAAEGLLTRRRIREQPLAEPLVMIIGHWRSGTTNVHNYLLQDPRFGCVSLLHCLAPHEFLTLRRLARRLLRHLVFSRRPMDRVPNGVDAPMSEDFALVGVTDQTHYLGYFFPRLLEQTFRETVLFEGLTPPQVERWADSYEWLLKKVTLACDGRPLALKNPANTGRVRYLVPRFPQMRFVFVRRNPFVVHASTCRLMERFLDRWSLQKYDRRDLEDAVLRRHADLLHRYFEDRPLIPQGRLVEISHEDMVARPVETLESVYHGLDLGDFEIVRKNVEQYTKTLTGYRTNVYDYDNASVERIRRTLGFVVDEWNYEPPAPGLGASYVGSRERMTVQPRPNGSAKWTRPEQPTDQSLIEE